MIYVPDIKNYQCFVVQSEGVIRAYEDIPRNNYTVNYRDYYISSNYIYRDGTQQFSQYGTLPICLDSDKITDNFYFRNDIADILITFSIIAIVGFLIPIKLVMRLFKRGRL